MKTRKIAGNLILLLFSTLFALVMVEILFRFYVFGWESLSVEKVNSFQPLGISGTIQRSSYPELIYEFKPNLNTYFKMARLQTNPEGLRDKAYPIEKQNGDIRIAVIGDSYTMPEGVEIEDAYHSVLEDMFNENKNSTSYQFINFGIGGYNLRQYLGVINHKAIQYTPDLILIGFCSNDFRVPPEHIFKNTYQVKPTGNPFFESFVIKEILQHALKRWTHPRTDFNSEEKVNYREDMFAKLGAFSKRTGIPVVIAPLVTKPRIWEGELKRLTAENGIHFVDVAPSFRGKEKVDYKIYPIDQHPNADAHRIFAQTIYAFLARIIHKNSSFLA